jgi:hypothetical protein
MTFSGVREWWSAVLILPLVIAAPISAAEEVFTGVDRVVAVGDVHGDFEAFVTILRSAGIIDAKNRWTGGASHLVQIGDVLDRGADSRKAMDLLMALEKQASKAGGRVHALIGNHEAMNVYGDLRYTVEGEFAAFRTQDSDRLRQALWEAESKPGVSRQQWEAEHPLGWVEHRIQFGPDGTYGKWIRKHNTAVKINDSLYVHGGISPKFASMTLTQLNETVSTELKKVTKINDDSVVAVDDGPLWYRGLAEGDAALAGHVDRLLQSYGVKRIVIGHTPTPGAVLPRFDGKVILVDAGMGVPYGSHRTCLVLEQDKLYAVHRGEKIDLPSGSPDDYLRYLKAAVGLETAPSPLNILVQQLLKVAPALVPR